MNDGAPTLQLDPTVQVTRYQSAMNNHCMPGSYYAEHLDEDVSAAANYDVGMFATTTGLFGRFLDGAGRGVADWLARRRPGWSPRRILELGCGLGHNTVPVARAFPSAEVVAVDLAAPMLRYGHARARGMGVTNATFMQGNVEALPFRAGTSTSSTRPCSCTRPRTAHCAVSCRPTRAARARWPSTSTSASRRSRHGRPTSSPRDQDYYSNEPFWTTLHDTDLPALLRARLRGRQGVRDDDPRDRRGRDAEGGRRGRGLGVAACGTPSGRSARDEARGRAAARRRGALGQAACSSPTRRRPAARDLVWAMAGELAVTRERLDTVERLLESSRALSREAIETCRPDPAAARERGRMQRSSTSRACCACCSRRSSR
ncbi:MAG: class I SAM-dependent methyltransferase [Steroidobacteraceae bacterium]